MSDAVWLSLALLLVLEGLMPALHPAAWRRMFEQIMRLTDQQIRLIGLSSMVVGLVLFWLLQMGSAS